MKSDMKEEEKQVLPDGRSRKSNGLMDDHVMENQTTPLKVIVLCMTGMNSTKNVKVLCSKYAKKKINAKNRNAKIKNLRKIY